MSGGLTYERLVHNEAEMDDLAASLVSLLRPGDIFALNGTLGAGKTRFVQGVARALGITEEVTSPTFTLHSVYRAPEGLALNHFDLYRLEDEADLDDIGYWDVLESDGVSFIEWAEKIPRCMPTDFVEMRISHTDDDARSVKVHAYGARARRLLCLWAGKPEAEWQKTDRF